MKLFDVCYVSYIFKNKNGQNVEKTKNLLVVGDNEMDAEMKFLNENIKFKRIISITEDNSNNLANNCPELIKIRNKFKD